MKKIIAIAMIVIFLVSNIPIVEAARTPTTTRTTSALSRYASSDTILSGINFYEDLGEAISVYPKQVDPTVLQSNLLTKGEVPVFIYLGGNTLGSFLGEQSSTGEPTIGIPSINNIVVTPITSNPYVQGISYYPPKSYYKDPLAPVKTILGTMDQKDLDNLGIILVEIKRFDNEDQIPEEIDLNLSARIEFSTDRSLNYGRLTKVIYQKAANEFTGGTTRESRTLFEAVQNILTKLKEGVSGQTDTGTISFAEGYNSISQESFLDGEYYVRLDSLDSDSATIQVYDYTLTPVGGLQKIKVGQTSNQISLSGISGLLGSSGVDIIKVRLDGIVNSLSKSATFQIYKNKEIDIVEVFESNYIPGTDWYVEKIEKEDDGSGEVKLTNFKDSGTINLEISKSTTNYNTEDPCKNIEDEKVDINSDFAFKLDCAAVTNFKKARELVSGSSSEYDIYTGKILEAYADLMTKAKLANADSDFNSFRSRILDELGNIKDTTNLDKYSTYLTLASAGISSSSENIKLGSEEAIIEVKEIKKHQGASASVRVGDDTSDYKINEALKNTGYKIIDINEDDVTVSKGEEIKGPGLLKIEDIKTNAKSGDLKRIGVQAETYQNKYDEKILEYAKEKDIDPLLVKALIIYESGFYPSLISKLNKEYCGAIGLMQLMPGTVKEVDSNAKLYKDLGNQESTCAFNIKDEGTKEKVLAQLAELDEIKDEEGTKDLDVRFDPNENIRIGIEFLKKKYDEYNEGSNYESKVKSYCANAEYQKQYAGYTGWERALRAYNGLGCGDTADTSYVEGVLAVRNLLASKLNEDSNYNKNSEKLKEHKYPDEADGENIKLEIEKKQEITSKTGKKIEVELKKVESLKAAQITIIPGRAKVYSTSEFNVRIPIDKGIKLINFTTEELDNHIGNLDSTIKTLDGIINTTEDIVKGWTIGCGATFAFITAKNFLIGNKANARSIVMNGYEEIQGLKDFCQANSITKVSLESAGKIGEFYQSYDECLMETGEFAESIIDEVDTKVDDFNDQLKDGKLYESLAYQELEKEIKDFNKDGKEFIVDSKDVKQYLILSSILNNKPDGLDKKEEGYFKTIAEEKTALIKSLEEKNSAYKETEKLFKDSNIEDKAEKEKLYKIAIQNLELQKSKSIEQRQKEWKGLTENNGGCAEINNILSTVTMSKDKKTAVGYVLKKDEKGNPVKFEEIKGLIPINEDDISKDAKKIIGSGQLFKKDSECYLVVDIVQESGKRSDYAANAKAEFYSDGKPYCIPYKDGNYLKVLKYAADGSASSISLMNVGSDGLLCTKDDISMKESASYLKEVEPAQLYKYKSFVDSFKCDDQGTVKIDKKVFECSYNAANRDTNKALGHCTDSMSVSDCKALFNICDPIVCPVSRFNAGGTWYVKDVVRSGIIGSIVLPQGSGDILPVCATGVLAGFKNIRSIFQSGKDCLTTQKEEGKSVGICDKIQSIYVCDVFWKEAGGAAKFVQNLFNGNVFSGSSIEGGGEYLQFSSSYENALKSVEFFTSEYGNLVDNSFKAKKLEQIKMEFCKGFVSGSIPNLGEFMTKLVNPRDPSQFIATMSSKPYSEKFGTLSYNVFFHIYAGTTQDISGSDKIGYRVYLRDSKTGRKLFVTYGDQGSTSENKDQIEYGGYITKNVDIVAGEGFNEVCIELNEVTECGFGRVTTDYGLNQLQDNAVTEEVTKNINSEEECIPELKESTGETIASTIGISSTTDSIVRVCSVEDPDGNSNKDYWRNVGSCGKDSSGVALGYCWLDTRSFSLQDLENYGNVSVYLSEAQNKYEEDLINKGIILSKEEREKKTEEIKAATTIEELKTILAGVNDQNLRSKGYGRAGEIYLEAGLAKEDYLTEGDHSKKEESEKAAEINAEIKGGAEGTPQAPAAVTKEPGLYILDNIIKGEKVAQLVLEKDALSLGINRIVFRVSSQKDGFDEQISDIQISSTKLEVFGQTLVANQGNNKQYTMVINDEKGKYKNSKADDIKVTVKTYGEVNGVQQKNGEYSKNVEASTKCELEGINILDDEKEYKQYIIKGAQPKLSTATGVTKLLENNLWAEIESGGCKPDGDVEGMRVGVSLIDRKMGTIIKNINTQIKWDSHKIEIPLPSNIKYGEDYRLRVSLLNYPEEDDKDITLVMEKACQITETYWARDKAGKQKIGELDRDNLETDSNDEDLARFYLIIKTTDGCETDELWATVIPDNCKNIVGIGQSTSAQLAACLSEESTIKINSNLFVKTFKLNKNLLMGGFVKTTCGVIEGYKKTDYPRKTDFCDEDLMSLGVK
ncbi:MAG: transglycosylase SLT domain-containing protein [Candidatus Nanoarchaeia archaeon]|nr:transglycosylase SLT domain-containing protein [Candidatus Nanoarchaeia archaeon]